MDRISGFGPFDGGSIPPGFILGPVDGGSSPSQPVDNFLTLCFYLFYENKCKSRRQNQN